MTKTRTHTMPIVVGFFAVILAYPMCGGDLDCLTELALPRYPELARQGHMSGEVEAAIEVDAAGKVRAVSANTEKTLLGLTVKRALTAVKVSDSCKGATIRITFRFELTKEVKPTDPGEVLFRAPSTFVIRASIPPINESRN